MRPQGRDAGSAPSRVGGGTYLVRGNARPVPLIASEFLLGMRAIEAYEAGSQPLDIRRATRAARDLALEEERLIYYGCEDDPEALLSLVRVEDSETVQRNATVIDPNLDDAATVIDRLHDAIEELALRGYAGPFALTIEPHLYTQIYSPNPTRDTLHVHLLASLFRGGIYMAPVIDRSHPDDPHGPRGAVVTVGRAFASLVVGQDWVTSYRGRDGVLYRFLIVSSLQLQISDPLSIQVLTAR
jgi:uncharacterized linocin/CFP29 family protein